jgi:hypothetical protein
MISNSGASYFRTISTGFSSSSTMITLGVAAGGTGIGGGAAAGGRGGVSLVIIVILAHAVESILISHLHDQLVVGLDHSL